MGVSLIPPIPKHTPRVSQSTASKDSGNRRAVGGPTKISSSEVNQRSCSQTNVTFNFYENIPPRLAAFAGVWLFARPCRLVISQRDVHQKLAFAHENLGGQPHLY